MKKTIVILILLILIGSGVYFFVNINKKEHVCDEGFRFVPSTQKCEPVDKPIDTEVVSLDFSKLTIQIPDTNITVQLKKDGEGTKYSGMYEDPEVPSMKGFASFDSKDLTEYSSDFVLLPFIINSGGTGQFLYVGLFDVKNNKQTSSVFVGDRVAIDSVQMSGEKIKINFKTRLDSESFAVSPTIPAQLVLVITNQKLVEHMRLQNADYSDVEIKSQLPLVSKGTLSLKGAIPGTWYFEATAGFRILDNSYTEIGFGSIQALSDWMTTQRVPFELASSTITYKGKGTIVIESDNPQGGEEGERKMKKMYIPVTFE